MGDRLRFGILGCGVIGPFHARAITDLPDDAELVAVADTVPDRARALAERAGVAWHDDYAALLARPEIDAICICTPSGMHAEHASDALRAGKHVVIEKPVDVQLGTIDALLEVRRETGLTAAVISQHRWDRATRLVREAVLDGLLGRLTVGAAQVRWWRTQEYYDSGDWRGTWALDGGGALMNQGIHTLDLLQWLMGDIAEVTAMTALRAHERIEVEDVTVGALRFESGALGVLTATTAAYPGLTARIEVHGDRGSAIIDADRLGYFHAADGPKGDQSEAELARFGASDAQGEGDAGADPTQLGDSHREQLREFIAAVRDGRDPLVTIEEGRKAVAAILAVYDSARNGGRPTPVEV